MSSTTGAPTEVAQLTLPTPFGEWQARVFDWEGSIHLCLCRGTIGDGQDILVRLHSEYGPSGSSRTIRPRPRRWKTPASAFDAWWDSPRRPIHGTFAT